MRPAGILGCRSLRASLPTRATLAAVALLAAVPVARRAWAQPLAPSSSAAPPAVAPKLVPPRLLSSPDVDYPREASGEATVVLALTIDASGDVKEAAATEGAEPFASAAIAAARTWRFDPATRDGAPIPSKIRFRVSFKAPVVTPAPVPTPEPAAVPVPGSKPAAGAGETPAGTANATPIEVLVEGEKLAPAVTSFSRAEVRQLPGAFGDPFRAIEALPGVTPIVSGLPFFYVRGAPPGNVGYFLDGIRVPYLFHVGLGPSVIHPGMVDRVDLYPGGYPARFGRYAGGIVSGETTAPRTDLHGEGNIRIFDAGALVEDGFANGKGTVLLGGRYAYTAAVFSLIAKDTKLDYRDYQARITYDLTDKDRLTLFSFGSYDLLGQTKNGLFSTAFGQEFYRVDLRYDHTFGPGTGLRWAVTFGWDQTKIGELRNGTDRMIGTRVELRHTLSSRALFRSGVDVVSDLDALSKPVYGDADNPDVKNFALLFPSRTDFAGGVWADVVYTPDPLVEVTPGVRADFFKSAGASKASVDPRLAMRFKVNDTFKIIHAYGLAHQAPSFIVPVPGLTPGTLANGLQSSFQTSAGVEIALPENTTATMTGFHNAFFDMTDAIGSGSLGGGSGILSDNRAAGRAFGFELFVRRRLTRRFGGFLSYTLSRSTRTIGGSTFVANFDRTHVANFALAYELGRNWRAGSRLVLYTGAPQIRTAPEGLITPPPTLTPNRDPLFYRIDVRLEKRWNFGERYWLAFVAEFLNATLHKETVNGQQIGPVAIPSVGLEGGL